jgi:CheY-like chemotaxis protein
MAVKVLVVDDDNDVRAMIVDVVTGFTQEAYRTAASERGADAFVAKYDMSTALLPLIHKLMRGTAAGPAAQPPHPRLDP